MIFSFFNLGPTGMNCLLRKEGRKEMFYLMTRSTYFYLRLYGVGYLMIPFVKQMKEGNVLFNDALNTFYLRLYGVRHIVKDHSDSEKGRKEGRKCCI